MRIIISEEQYRYILENKLTNKPIDKNLLEISVDEFLPIWSIFIKTYKKKGYDGLKLYGDLNLSELHVDDIEKILNEVVIVTGDLDLRDTTIKSLGSLEEVGGYLDLRKTPIKSLGKLRKVGDSLNLGKSEIEDLGELNFVGESLALYGTPIKSLGNLVYVGYDLFIMDTPKLHMSDEEIRSQVEIKKRIYKK